ncbi:MAG TPA: GtrA family protein [Bacillota bacterium]|nr:GtrA family protein [Bacillota bacterium]
MKTLKRMMKSQLIRYIISGACTTALNVGLFYLLRKVLLFPLFLSNFISIITAILFAFVVNREIVFESERKGGKYISQEFFLFLSMRFISMAIEMLGVWFTVEVLLFSDICGKMTMQGAVIIFNFIFSKYIIFKKGSVSNKPVQE